MSGSDFRLRWSGITHRGRFRKNNEDSFLGVTFDAEEFKYLGKVGEGALGTGDFVFAVSDGMGGANAGEYASKIAVQKIAELMPRSFWMGASGFSSGRQDILNEVVLHINQEMLNMARHYEECRGMGATLSMIWFTPEKAHFAHVGDSRIYFIPKGHKMVQVTHDHSFVGRLFREGKLNEREAKTHPKRNELDQVLGGGSSYVAPQLGEVAYGPGDFFVLVTDGITDGLADRKIEQLVAAPPQTVAGKEPAHRLHEEALFNSGRDNLTAVVVEVLAG